MAALGALSAPALAAEIAPEPGRYRGETKQGRLASLRVGDARHVRHVRLRWVARCSKHPENRWGVDATEWSDSLGTGIEQDGARFSDAGRYEKDGGGGYRGRITAKVTGAFTSSTRASGRFKIEVRVTRNGKFVDTCRISRRFSVKHVDGRRARSTGG